MGLFRNNPKGGIVDVIRCDKKNYLIWKWRPVDSELGESSRENGIRWGSPIRVREGCVAVFVYSGKDGFVQDYIVGPADTVADTSNLPILASVTELLYNGSAPFQAEIYFINLAETVQTKFAVPYFDVFDPENKEFSVPVAVRGTIDFNINDYQLFVKKHRLDDFSIEELQSQIKDAVIEKIKNTVINAPEYYGIPVVQIERKASEIKSDIVDNLREKLHDDYGIYLKDISIAGITIDKDSEDYAALISITKNITADLKKAHAKAENKDIAANQKLGVFGKAASMFVDIKEGAYARRKQTQREYSREYETELAGRVGAAGAKIISALGNKGNTSAGSGVKTPPPVPVVKYHVVMFGQSAGPYDVSTLRKMADEGSLKPESLVWTEGMDSWTEAQKISDLIPLFSARDSSSPPPVPPIPGK